MVILGGMLLGVTLKHPPYGGPSGSDAGGNPWRLRANQLRVCVDIGMLWIYICALIAVLAHAGDRASDGRLRHTASIRIAMLIHITAINGGDLAVCYLARRCEQGGVLNLANADADAKRGARPRLRLSLLLGPAASSVLPAVLPQWHEVLANRPRIEDFRPCIGAWTRAL